MKLIKDIRTVSTGTMLIHSTHGVVRFIRFNFGKSRVEKVDWEFRTIEGNLKQVFCWVECDVMTEKLVGYATLKEVELAEYNM